MREKRENIFPVHRLDYKINELLDKFASNEVADAINKGFNSKVVIIDQEGPLTTAAYIKRNVTGYGQVTISSAFYQMLWVISEFVVKMTDYDILYNSITTEEERRQIINELENFIKNPSFIDRALSTLSITSMRDQYENTLGEMYQMLIDIEYKEKIFKKIELSYEIIRKELTSLEEVYQLNMDSHYGRLVNGVISYAMTFILLHELAHYINEYGLGRSKSNEEQRIREKEADDKAFDWVYSKCDKKERFTAFLGILTTFLCFILFNPQLKYSKDATHPSDIDRLYEYFNRIKDENEKYSKVLISFFSSWAKYFNISDFPSLNNNIQESTKILENYLRLKMTFD